jgi:hypothetical protein
MKGKKMKEAASQQQPAPVESPAAGGSVRLYEIGILVAMLVVMVFIRLHAFQMPLERDEANYAYIGSRLFDGDRMYVDQWDHQPPAVFGFYGLLGRVLGDAPSVFRWTATVFSGITLLLVFFTMRGFYSKPVAFFSAALWALSSADTGMEGDGCNREIYMNTFAVLGLLMLLRYAAKGRWWQLLASGAAIGIGSAFKPILAVQWVCFVPWLLFAERAKGERAFPAWRFVRSLLLFGAGPALIWGGQWLYFAVTGRGDLFIQSCFFYNVGYSERRDKGILVRLWHFFGTAEAETPFRAWADKWPFRSAAALWIAGALGLVVGRWRRAPSPDRLLRLFLLAAFLEASLPGQFWRHYYYLALPALVVLAALAMDRLLGILPAADVAKAGSKTAWNKGVLLAALYAVLVVAGLEWREYKWYFRLEPDQLTYLRFGLDNLKARDLGAQVAEVTDPDDFVYQFGSDVGIYYYSKRRCASRFTMHYPFKEWALDNQKNQQTLIEELIKRTPRLILLCDQPFPALSRFLSGRYHLVARILDNQGFVSMGVFEDKTKPVKSISWEWKYEHLDHILAMMQEIPELAAPQKK